MSEAVTLTYGAGIEIVLTPDRALPRHCTVMVLAPTREEVHSIFEDIADNYAYARFTDPVQTADGRWGALGHVSDLPETIEDIVCSILH